MVVVTGGAGFIGSCLIWKLNKEGISDIVVVDEPITPEKEKNLKGKKIGDFIDKEKFLSLVNSNKLGKKFDAIFHLGACASTTLMDMDYFIKNNVEYSKKLAAYSSSNKIRFIYASSGATYGDGSLGFSDADDVTLKLKPLNPYGYSKHLFDVWLINSGVINEVVGLKYFNVFGPNEYHKEDMRSVIAKSFDQAVRDKKMRLFKSYKKEYEDGGQKRDFIYVKDAIDATYFFFENRDNNGIYNIGTGQAQSWNDLAKALFNALGMESKIEYFDMPDGLRDKYQYFTQADISKLRGAGYKKNFLPLEESVKEYAGFLKRKSYL